MTMPFKRTSFIKRPSWPLLLLLLLISSSFAFVVHQPLRRNALHGQNDKNEGIVFDDFDFPVGNLGASSSLDSGLQERLTRLATREQESLEIISQNWKHGHWSVRGCSLDPGDAGFGEQKVQISALVSRDGEDIILVGRTDGTLCWLRLGSEYLATFTNQLTAKESSDDTIAVREELRRDESASISLSLDAYTSPEEARSDKALSNFEIVAQVQATSASIVDMAVVGDGANDRQMLFVLCTSLDDPIRQFEVRDDGPVSLESVSVPMKTVDSEASPVIAIKAIREQFLLSVTKSGILSVWRPDMVTPSTVSSLSSSLEDKDYILSCDADDDFVYIGTSLGFVMVYSVDQILEGITEPLKSFAVFATAGVSAIRTTGEGLMGLGRPTKTIALITGSTLGEIKQWELFPRGIQSLEFWPKISNQKIPGKAHLLLKGPQQSMADSTPESAILALEKVQDGIVLSATKDQLTIWNAATGKANCDMNGLEFEHGASCLILSEHLLVTNGMKQFVCVHDFSIDPNLEVRDMIVPMDDEDE